MIFEIKKIVDIIFWGNVLVKFKERCRVKLTFEFEITISQYRYWSVFSRIEIISIFSRLTEQI